MMESVVTFQTLAESILDDMVKNLIRQQTVNHLAKHMAVQETLGTGQTTTVNYSKDSDKDIFGQDKWKLKAADTSKYFPCDNCGRKIAGGRFAQHLSKCLERGRR